MSASLFYSPTRSRNTITSLLAALTLLTLGACADSATAPSGTAMVPSDSTTVAGAGGSAGQEPIDKGATHAAHLIPVSSTPMGAPPLSGQGRRQPDEGNRAPNPPMPKERPEGHNEEASSVSSTKPLIYTYGAVQTAPKIYLVYWGPTWFTGGDPYGVANRLHYFYQGLGASTWANVLKQFATSYGSFTNPAGQYKGWHQDMTAVPAHPTSAQMALAARRAAIYFNDFSYNAQYVIATPYGVVDQLSNGTETGKPGCGWHNFTYAGPSGHWVTYTSLPYAPYLYTLGLGCGYGSVNGAVNGKLDGVTITASHEYGESVNDPGLYAWRDVDGDENGDKCAWRNLANYKLTNGYSLPVQPLWSNLWRTQYGNGCLYSQ
jgi:hypothetical protein